MFNNYDPMKFVKEIHNLNKKQMNNDEDSTPNNSTTIEYFDDSLTTEIKYEEHIDSSIKNDFNQNFTNKHSDNEIENDIDNHKESKVKNAKSHFWTIALLACGALIFILYRNICAMPLEINSTFGDTPITINATYNTRYHVAKIDLTIDEFIEDWQVNLTNGKIEAIKMVCETQDKTVKKEYKFNDIELTEGQQIKGSITADNMNLKDFNLLKELLSGQIEIFTPVIVSLDSSERNKIKQYYESGSWLMGLMWANALIGGY